MLSVKVLSVEWVSRVVTHINKRNVLFFLLSMVATWMAYSPLNDLLSSATQSDSYSHIVLIPVASGYIIFLYRRAIFEDSKYSYSIGFPVVILGVLLYEFGRHQGDTLNLNDYSSLVILSVVVFWIGAFILFFGTRAARIAIFPLFFLALMIPVPSILMDKIIHLFLIGSSEITYLIFELTGIPVSREGFVFQLPGISVEIAKQCSGIRSSIALFITGILAAQYFLQTGWKRIILVFSVAPLAILKNGIRIVALSLLGIYVDERILTDGFLHRSGGFVFFLPALSLLGIILWGLRKSESGKGKNAASR